VIQLRPQLPQEEGEVAVVPALLLRVFERQGRRSAALDVV
jgi:hypothetical protein